MKYFGIGLSIIVFLLIAITLYMMIDVLARRESLTPYVTYSNLLYLATGCEIYKQQNGDYPTNIANLQSLRPDFAQVMYDEYGNDVTLVPFNKSLGYGELICSNHVGDTIVSNKYTIILRFPRDAEANKLWNEEIGSRAKGAEFHSN